VSMARRYDSQPRMQSWWQAAVANLAWAIATRSRPLRGKAFPGWRMGGRFLGIVMTAAAAIATTMVLLDARIAEAVRGSPQWLHILFQEVTDFGKSGWFLWPSGMLLLAIAVLASSALPQFSRMVLAACAVRISFVFMAIALPSLVVTIGKRLIGRARPFVDGHADPFLYMHPVWRPDYASMPSGHATTGFAAMAAIALIWPRLRIPMLIYALLIAASRVVLDAHYLSDVIAGAAVGVGGALLVRDWFAARRLAFVIGADGGIRRLSAISPVRIKRIVRSLMAP